MAEFFGAWVTAWDFDQAHFRPLVIDDLQHLGSDAANQAKLVPDGDSGKFDHKQLLPNLSHRAVEGGQCTSKKDTQVLREQHILFQNDLAAGDLP